MKKLLGVALILVLAGAASSFAGAVISNGAGVKLGVNDQGHLNFTDGTHPDNTGAGATPRWGVSFDFDPGVGTDYRDATSPGCFCEGWGVAVNGLTSGYANVAIDGVVNLTVDPSALPTASTFTSVVHLTSLPGITVTHAFAPSTSPSLYEAKVTITNTTGAGVANVTYRRVMDWDVPPTEFDEFVTIGGWPADDLIHSSNDGFDMANPLILSVGLGGCGPDDTNFVKCFGPASHDHGALFDFNFGPLANGGSVNFSIFYGAAFGEAAILGALGSVGTEVYSLGYSTLPGSGLANTDGVVFGFGFKGVGGEPIEEPIPEPGTMLLLGSGVAALAARRRRKV